MATTLLIVVLIVLLIAGAIAAFAVALARRSKAQLAANVEPAPGMPSGAPPQWAATHTPEAKMHRRLVALARASAALPLGEAAAIERRAANEYRIQELDRRLIGLASAPEAVLRDAVGAMEPDVAAAEAEVAALASLPPLA